VENRGTEVREELPLGCAVGVTGLGHHEGPGAEKKNKSAFPGATGGKKRKTKGSRVGGGCTGSAYRRVIVRKGRTRGKKKNPLRRPSWVSEKRYEK